MKKRPQNEIITYRTEQEPVEGKPILAAFGLECRTHCEHFPKIKVGSLSCDRCEFHGGKEAFATSTGCSQRYGGTSEHGNIYCKKA